MDPIRRSLAGEGHLHIDRPVPVLVLYRRRPDDAGTAELVMGSGSHLIAGDMDQDELEGMITEIVEPSADRFGAFLLLEIWSVDPEDALPRIKIYAQSQEGKVPEIASGLARELRACGSIPNEAEIVLDEGAPPGLPPALAADKRQELGCLVIGLEVPAVYRDRGNRVFPEILRPLSRDLSHVLSRVFFEFAQVHTTFKPKDFRELGRRTVLEAGWKVDGRLAEIGKRLDLLLNITPVNSVTEWEEFREGDYRTEPNFHYRPLPFDPDLVKRELFDLPVEDVEDPNITYLLREKRSELDRIVTMLADRDTPRFLQESISLFGAVDDQLLSQAGKLLELSPREPDDVWVSSTEFALRAEIELDRYRERWSDFQGTVEIRHDVPGVMVVHGSLLVGAETRIRPGRVEPLIHHEVGTHLVTGHNGATQSLKMLAVGLPGYEQTQEGLAVLAELLSGGLGVDRLRTLAARVVAVQRMIEGRTFTEVFAEMHEDHGVDPRGAWTLCMRVFRSGGLTKDAIYLRGLLNVMDHLAGGGSLEPLFVGKMALEHIPLIEELLWRRILEPAEVLPLWLEHKSATACLERVKSGSDLLDLIA